MSAKIIDGKAIAAELRAAVAVETRRLTADHNIVPGLAVVQLGENPASITYVKSKARALVEVGMRPYDHYLPASTSETELLSLVAKLNVDPAVNGILVQLPLPPQIESAKILASRPGQGRRWLSSAQCRPADEGLAGAGAVHAARLHQAGQDRACLAAGVEAVVVGRSNIVGKPLVQMLLAENATVTVAHSQTRDLPAECRRADLLIAAIGRRNSCAAIGSSRARP